MQNAGNNIPLSKQVQYFNTTRSKMIAAVGSGVVNTLLYSSVVLIEIGINDLTAFANAQAQQARNRSSGAELQSDVAAAFFGSLMSNYSAAITVRIVDCYAASTII
jgi:lysophospholipase L1-like esterase